jgi:TolB protein
MLLTFRFLVQKIATLLLLSGLVHLPLSAQFRVEVTGVGMSQLPVAIVAFKGEASALHKLGAIVQADLERTGQFRGLDTAGREMDELSRPDFSSWRQASADALLVGSVTRLADGRYDVRARLWDVVKGQDRGIYRDTTSATHLRLAAHRVADWMYEQLTGTPGAFASRLAYVTRQANRYVLWVADSDGEGAQQALSSQEPIISPKWSPTGTHLAYVSFELRKPVIYVHELATGQRKVVANFRGSNSAPAWSPDGRSLVATLSRDGGSQLYRIDLSGTEPRRLTQTAGIDTEPTFTPDGTQLYFVSDRGGSPQIYRMSAQGGAAERVTFGGNYNISPAISPDGKWLAYVNRNGGQFRVHLMELATGQVRALTETSADERPSFAPNSRLLAYATVAQGQEALMTSSLDGRVRARLASRGGDIREPDWGPRRN